MINYQFLLAIHTEKLKLLSFFFQLTIHGSNFCQQFCAEIMWQFGVRMKIGNIQEFTRFN
jgi:hypothetical protein